MRTRDYSLKLEIFQRCPRCCMSFLAGFLFYNVFVSNLYTQKKTALYYDWYDGSMKNFAQNYNISATMS